MTRYAGKDGARRRGWATEAFCWLLRRKLYLSALTAPLDGPRRLSRAVGIVGERLMVPSFPLRRF